MSASATQGSHKKSPSGHHRTTLSGYIFASKAHIDNRKKLVKQQYVLHISSSYGELWPPAAEIGSVVWGTPANFNRFCILAALLRGTLAVGISQILRNEQRAPLCSAGRPSRWAMAHISSRIIIYHTI